MKKIIIALLLVTGCLLAQAQKTAKALSPKELKLFNEHVLGGHPGPLGSTIYIRQGYVVQYNFSYRIPNWVAYHVIPDYLNTPQREKKYSYFLTDPDMDNAVKDEDYTGTGYARGHMAPYFVMGGDRDNDGVYADLLDDSADPEDDTTVFQANYMSNMSPQDQSALNGPGGPWYALETVIRNKLVKGKKMEMNVVVGCIVDDPTHLNTLKNKKGETGIVIPTRFFQVLISKDLSGKYQTAGFLFPHVKERKELPSEALLDYLVPVDSIEQITGLDFFRLLEDDVASVEVIRNVEYWKPFFE